MAERQTNDDNGSSGRPRPATREERVGGGVNPGQTGPAQPKAVEDPHPSNEESYGEERHPGGARPPEGPATGAEKPHRR